MAPTVALSANPTTVSSGGSSTLNWSSSHTSACTATGAWSGAKATSGNQTISNIAATGTYTLTCSGAGGSASQSVTVTVSSSSGPAPTVALNANPTTVASGGGSTLSWSSSNATSCTATSSPANSNWNSSNKPTSGSQSLDNLTATTNFTLTCSGSGGSASQTRTVTVTSTPPPVGSGSSLAQTAAAMQPGEWRELVTTNLEPTLFNPTCAATGSIFPYSEDAVWDPVSRRVLFIGSDHVHCDTMAQRFIAYSESTNAWSTQPNPPWFSNGVRHGYDHSAMDGANGILYHFPYAGYGGRPLHRYDTRTSAWLSDTASGPSMDCCAGVEHFAEFTGGITTAAPGGVVLAGNGNVYVYRAETNSWTGALSAARLNFGDYHTVAEYNPVHKVTIFGGGEIYNPYQAFNTLYKLAPDGSITPLAGAPFNLRVNQSIVTVDPVGGDYLVFGPNGEFYALNPVTNTWTQQPGPPPFASPKRESGVMTVDLTVAAPISTYGVVMFIKHIPGNAAQTKVYLYKHKALVGGIHMPSAADEKATYQKWGWTWNTSAEPAAVSEPVSNYSVNNPDVHGDTEGDDLWTHLMMYRRSGNPVYLNRAQAWLNYFKNSYREDCTAFPNGSFCYDRGAFGLDHLWGSGLVAWYEHSCLTGNCDTATLTEAENLAAEVESLWGPSSTFSCLPANACLHYGLRQAARHLLLATRVAEATGNNRWVQLRDQILARILASPMWDATRGMYFLGDWMTDSNFGAGAYASGVRVQSTFQIGVLAEAFFHVYRLTGNTVVRERLAAMAEFAYQHGLDPTYQYAGNMFGLKNGQTVHSYNTSQSTTLNCSTYWDPVYTTSLVNVLVMGYKFTGERRYYDRARTLFNRGSKGIYGQACTRAAADDVAHHFVDTRFASASSYYMYDYNKGELQYTYLLFENGGLAP